MKGDLWMGYLSVFYRNRRIFRAKSYTAPSGKSVPVALTSVSTLHKEIPLAPEVTRRKPFRIADATMRCGTIDCILRLRAEGKTGNLTALNFANAFMPGGGYVLGGNAQEESLCRASLLYYALKSCKGMYRHNRLRPTPLYSDYMIYSRDVPIFANDAGELLEEPCTASFLTAPAVNRNFARLVCSQSKINRVMDVRIQKLVSLAVAQGSEVLVLGAFGCGMFGNRREDVLPMLENAVNRFVPDEMQVVFAQP